MPDPVRFDGGPARNAPNVRRDGVSVEEAAKLFAAGRGWLDVNVEAHRGDEMRYRPIGPIVRGMVGVVVVRGVGTSRPPGHPREAAGREIHARVTGLRRPMGSTIATSYRDPVGTGP